MCSLLIGFGTNNAFYFIYNVSIITLLSGITMPVMGKVRLCTTGFTERLSAKALTRLVINLMKHIVIFVRKPLYFYE